MIVCPNGFLPIYKNTKNMKLMVVKVYTLSIYFLIPKQQKDYFKIVFECQV